MNALDIHVALTLGSLDLHVNFTAQPGEVIALLGPNGAGKTTLLRCITGQAPIDSGHIRFGEQVWDDPSLNVFVAPEHRGEALAVRHVQHELEFTLRELQDAARLGSVV